MKLNECDQTGLALSYTFKNTNTVLQKNVFFHRLAWKSFCAKLMHLSFFNAKLLSLKVWQVVSFVVETYHCGISRTLLNYVLPNNHNWTGSFIKVFVKKCPFTSVFWQFKTIIACIEWRFPQHCAINHPCKDHPITFSRNIHKHFQTSQIFFSIYSLKTYFRLYGYFVFSCQVNNSFISGRLGVM